jgi:ElaB/YqjD/DUF883 family membrane-anchored ribosome-binding protein
MPQAMLERTSEYIAESAQKASRTTSAIGDAIQDGIGIVKRAARQGRDVAEEAFDNASQHIKRHPVKAVATTFAVGLIAGTLVGWMIRRR